MIVIAFQGKYRETMKAIEDKYHCKAAVFDSETGEYAGFIMIDGLSFSE